MAQAVCVWHVSDQGGDRQHSDRAESSAAEQIGSMAWSRKQSKGKGSKHLARVWG